MFSGSRKSQRRALLAIDLLAQVISFFAAIYIRFYGTTDWENMFKWYNGLYYILLELVIALYVVIFFVNDIKHRPLVEQNPFEKAVNVIKNQLIMVLCLGLLLYLIKQGLWASRAVVGLMFIFDIIIDTAFRFMYGRFLYKNAREKIIKRKYILVTDKNLAVLAARRINLSKSQYRQFIGIVYTEDEVQEDMIEGIPVLGQLKDLSHIKESYPFDEVLVYLPGRARRQMDEMLIKSFEHLGVPVNWAFDFMNQNTAAGLIRKLGEIDVIYWSGMLIRNAVLGVEFCVSNMSEAVLYIRDNIKELSGKYICLSNVHTTVMAHEDPDYCDVQNGAAIVFPDGAPIARILRHRGFSRAERVAGPDLMRAMFISAMDGGISMYFYGSSEETIRLLEKNIRSTYPGIDIRGFESPPFRQLTPEEDREAIERINNSGADIVWIGLGAPKQEKWMRDHKDVIKPLMIGVGAGFDFHAGTIKRAPEWIQSIGMEWLYRLFQDPRRLVRRYVITNIKFMWYMFTKK